MPELDPITLLNLGPMRPGQGEGLEALPRTVQMTALLRHIADTIAASPQRGLPLRVEGPDRNPVNQIVDGILRKIERADLIVCDVSGTSQNVMYELGLVHALGIPYVVVTEDDRPPFYLRQTAVISRFAIADRFDPTLSGHVALQERLRAFIDAIRGDPGSDASPEDFAQNPVSAYFDGLPIVDISAPAGLAAGYWTNALLRFVRRGGYFGRPTRQVVFAAPPGATPQAPMALPIAHFVAVQPVDGLRGAYDQDVQALERTLAARGLVTMSGAIQQADENDMRSFGAKFLARAGADGPPVPASPGIVLDIPTTLYALQHSPRIARLDRMPRTPGWTVAALKRRRYDHMLHRFGRLLDYFLNRAEHQGHAHQVHYVSLGELPALLDRLLAAG